MTASVTLLFAAWVGLVCGGLIAYLYRSADRKASQYLSMAVREVTGDLRENLARPGPAGESTEGVIAIVNEEAREGVFGNLGLAVIAPDGKVAWRSQHEAPPWPGTPDDGWRVATVPAGASTVVLGFDWAHTRETLREEAVTLLCLGLLAVVAAALGSWVLVGRTLAPIGLLSRQARDASAESLQVFLRAPSEDAEISELVTTLNGLLARLAETAAAKARFYAAASHELRTPLQAVSGHLELALGRSRTGDEYRAAINEALSQTRRLTRLAQDLLLLNQIESGRPGQLSEPVDVGEVCERALRQMQSTVAQRGLRLSVGAVLLSAGAIPEATVFAPPTHVEILVRNIIENAIRYARPGGEVQLSLERCGEGALLRVFNECPPVADWDSASLFDPFARLDASRSAATGGNGLGLAICGAIANANRWTVALDHTGEGVLATVLFVGRRADGDDGVGGARNRDAA
jgi:signal transduction histidine kinase